MVDASVAGRRPGAGRIDAALADLERRRRDRWAVVGLLVVAAATAVLLLTMDLDPRRLAPWAALALLVLTVVYGLWVAIEERRARRLTRDLLSERAKVVADEARLAALTSLTATTRDVTAADDLPAVFDRLLAGVRVLANASSGVVLLRTGDELTVAAAFGVTAPRRGTVVTGDAGAAGVAIARGEPIRAGRGAPWNGVTGDASIAAPLRLPDRVVGAIVAVRDRTLPPFGDEDEAAVALFAQHAALAVRNAWRLDHEHERVARLLGEVERLAAELEDRREAIRARAEAATGMVHDLRAPLTAVRGFVQLLRDRDDRFTPERRAAVLDDVLGELERAKQLVASLLAVAAAEAGVVGQEAIVDVAAVARDVGRLGRGRLAERGGGGRLTVDAAGPAPVAGTRDGLARIVANLIDNAITHTPPGTDVELDVSRVADSIVVRVRDHGPPVEAARLEGAFEPFVHGPGGETGSGLGLHVVRSLVEALGGTARLEPVGDGGTLAEVVLPAVSPAAVR